MRNKRLLHEVCHNSRMSEPVVGPPPISLWTLAFFRRIVRSYFRRHFRAVQVQGAEHFTNVGDGPLIVYGNHVSWWDPMLITFMAHRLLPNRRHYAPMLAEPLKRYAILRKIGIFPVELGSRKGAVEFAQTAGRILASGGVLWITPQGRFADVRERPLGFKSGLAQLVKSVPNVRLIPMAVEYTFWSERLPEALARVGAEFSVDTSLDAATITQQLELTLETLMDELREVSLTRDPLQFSTILEGRRGTGGFYALGKRIRALVTGKSFQADHSARDVKEEKAAQI